MKKLFWIVLAAMPLAHAAELPNQVDAFVNTQHIDSWNRFADRVMAFQARQIAGRDLRVEERVGKYGGEAAKGLKFRERRFIDRNSGKLLSVVRTDHANTEDTQIGEVYIHDEAGRLVRDYAFIYLPWARGAPIRTFVNLHHYPENLHAYRQFDASGVVTFEYCKGIVDGVPVDFRISEDESWGEQGTPNHYRACFAALPRQAGTYLDPR